MVTTYKRNGYSLQFVILSVITLFLILSTLRLRAENNQPPVLSDVTINNIQNGIHSDNYGLKMSCIYMAGKYKIKKVSKDLVQEMKNSDNKELCQMLVWSLYQIGNESCCKEMKTLIENHPSRKVREFCNSLNQIKQYESIREKSDSKEF